MISTNNALTHILVYIIAPNAHAEVTMSLHMLAMHSFSGEGPECSTEWRINISYCLLLLPNCGPVGNFREGYLCTKHTNG